MRYPQLFPILAPMIRGFFNFILFSSIYIAICAVLMTWQTIFILQPDDILLQTQVVLSYYGFVFFSTICSYNFHWYLTPGSPNYSERILWGQRRRKLQLLGCAIGLLGAIWCGIPLLPHWLPLSGAVLLTFLYSAPKVPHKAFRWLSKIAIGKTIFLTFVWTYVTTILPALIIGHANEQELLYLTIHRFFLIYAICILFDYRDRAQDREQGIRSLITLLPEPQLDKLYYGSVLLAGIFAMLMAPAIPIFVLFSLLLPVSVTAMVKRYAQTHNSDYLYYFFLDGLMMLSAVLHFLWVNAGGI